MSESLDVNRKMADEYMRLRDVATTWKQKAKTNSKDARDGRKAQSELSKARDDISAILEEREIFITQRNELLNDIKRLNLELSRVHKDYSNAIDDNTKFAADIESLKQQLANVKSELNHNKNALSMAEHHRNKAEIDLGQAVFNLDKAVAEKDRDKAFYEARIVALSSPSVPTSQPDMEAPVTARDAERAVLLSRIDNLRKELTVRDNELAKLRSEVSLSDDVNTLRAELAEAKAVSARLSGMYEQKSKDFRDSELERLTLLGKQILVDGAAPKDTPPARPRPASRRGRQRSRSTSLADGVGGKGRSSTPAAATQTPASSQPFWLDEPLFTKHVAAVTTATMSALPHLPFEAAIASAFTTVRNVGPPPPLKLDKKPGARRSNAPSPQTAQTTPAGPQGNFTFADIAKAATTNDGGATKKPTWRAIETSKALVLRPSTKGTRVSELHLKIPKTTESADLFRLKGTALLDRVAKIISDHSEPAPRMALRDNPLVLVKWSMKGNLVLKCSKPMDDLIKDGIKDALTYFLPSPDAEIMVLNKPPTTALKFLAVPRHNLDGTDTDEMDLLNDLTAHPMWANIELWANPKFINLKAGMAGATVVVSVVDDNQGNAAYAPVRDGSNSLYSPSVANASPGATQARGAQQTSSYVLAAAARMILDNTTDIAKPAKKDQGMRAPLFAETAAVTICLPHENVPSGSAVAFPKKNAKDAQATRKTVGRKKVGFSAPDADGFIQVGVTPGIARIDVVPDPVPGPPDSLKPPSGSILGAIADEALRPELKGNEEARRLMQETLLDEAAFAAADAANPSVHELLETLQSEVDFLFVQENPSSFIRNIPSSTSEKGDPLIGPVHHRQWQCVEKSSIQPSSQVAIYINKRFLVNYQIFPDFSLTSDPNVLMVTLRHNIVRSKHFSLINVYNPPKTNNAAIHSLLSVLPRLDDVLVIEGDFNLHSGIWDPSRVSSPPLPTQLFNKLSDASFGLVNDDGAPTWTNRRGSFSVIDLVFINDALAPLFPDVFVNLEGRGRSDHALISLIFGTTDHWGRPYIPSGEEEEDQFVTDLASSIRTRSALLNVSEATGLIADDILDSWNRNAKAPRIGGKSISWWTAACQQAKDTYLASRTRENQRAYDAVTKAARMDFFNRKIDQMTANDSPWEGVRWTKPRPPPKFSTILRDGRPIPDVETLFDTMHAHFSTSTAAEHVSWAAIDKIPQRPERSFPLISLKELWDALRPTTNSSAPGPDHVTWRHLKLALSIPDTDAALVRLYNNVCREGIWPSHFKDSYSVIIPKPNKPDYTIPKAYRPIALLNTMGKLLTKILANRLQHDAAEHGLLHRDQFGGIKKHSTIDAGLALMDFISEHRERGWHTSVCAIDVAQFFPSLSHNVMTRILERLGFSHTIVTLIKSYFSERVTSYKWDSATSHKYDFSLGTPQGDCLSPILSALYISTAIRKVFPETMPPASTRPTSTSSGFICYSSSKLFSIWDYKSKPLKPN
ncbi:hypothetical protein AX14_003194 [Amanita brunnescens Koide BX004]|nr:hypothetical protein AX14_003194 [Amanita brunnescens Koide BX004]